MWIFYNCINRIYSFVCVDEIFPMYKINESVNEYLMIIILRKFLNNSEDKKYL